MPWKGSWIFMMRRQMLRTFTYRLPTAFGGHLTSLTSAWAGSHYQPMALSGVMWVYLTVVWILNVPQRSKCCVQSQASSGLSQKPWWKDHGNVSSVSLPRSKLSEASLVGVRVLRELWLWFLETWLSSWWDWSYQSRGNSLLVCNSWDTMCPLCSLAGAASCWLGLIVLWILLALPRFSPGNRIGGSVLLSRLLDRRLMQGLVPPSAFVAFVSHPQLSHSTPAVQDPYSCSFGSVLKVWSPAALLGGRRPFGMRAWWEVFCHRGILSQGILAPCSSFASWLWV